MTRARVVSLLLVFSSLCFHAVAQEQAAPGARSSSLFKSGNVTLDKTISPYSLGKVVVAENLAVATILSAAPAEAQGRYLTLDEALKKKLLTVKEMSGGGSVPMLEVVSSSDMPIFLPFGSILSGGKQDRMIREDVLLQPKEKTKIAVYCIEQGRWQPGRSQGVFAASSQQASQSLKSLGKAQYPQGAIWGEVGSKNRLLGNPSRSANFQGNVETAAFQKLTKQLEGVREGVAKQNRVCGAVVILDGKVVGTEIFADEAYFRKVWPQLFNSYVIDAASREGTVKIDADKAKALAEAFLAGIDSARVTEKSEKDLVRLAIESDTCLGHALVENQKRRLIYLGYFLKPKQSASNMSHQPMPQPYQQLQRQRPGGSFPATARSIPSRGARILSADNVAESVGENRWNWTVFIKGDQQDVEGIRCVEYTLHPTFPNPVRLVCDTADTKRPFALSATGWGTFTIGIRVFMKDGRHEDFEHRLKF